MKKTLLAVALLLALVGKAPADIGPAQNVTSASAGDIHPCGGGAYCGNLVNGNLAVTATYLLDLSQYNASKVSVQNNYSTVTFATASISDGQKCTGNFTVASNAGMINPGATLTGCGRSFVSGTDFAVDVNYSSMTAKNIKTALTAACSGLAFSQTTGMSIVYTTSTLDSSTACNLISSNQAYIATAAVTAGVDSGFVLGSAQIKQANHGFVTGSAVLYGGAVDTSKIIGGLTAQTTYYVNKVSDYYLQLMATKADAVAGTNGIVITSTNTNTTANAFSFAQVVWSGTASFIWQVSNDNSSWATAPSTGTVSAGTTSAAASVFADFGSLGYRFLRLSYTAPTFGALNIVAPVVLRP